MNAILLLAGRSKRFWPLAEKSFFPIAGRPLLQHQIERLKAGGFDDVTLVAGKHNLEQAKALFPNLTCVEQTDLDKGMQGALLDALPRFGSEPVLIVGGNDVIDPAGYRAVKEAMEAGADGAILAKKVTRYFPGGYLTVENARIRGIVEKPAPGSEPSDLVNIVTHAHKDASALLKALQSQTNDRDDAYERALDALFKEKNYQAVSYDGPWHPVKFPWHLLDLLPVLLGEIAAPSTHPTATVHPSAVITGNVVIDEGAKIMPFACISGPAYIGKRAIVGNGALVRGSSVGNDSVVGYVTEVKDSLLAEHVWLHMAYAGDSVVGANTSFGAGAVTGNLRLDEAEVVSAHNDAKLGTGRTKVGAIIGENCRIGIHVGINPGVKIGEGSFISSMALVSEDVPARSFVTMKEGKMHVRENRTEAPRPEGREGYKKGI